MSDARYRRAELLANAAIAVVAGLLVLVLAVRWLLPDTPARGPRMGIAAGSTVSVPGVSWSGSPQTLLLVLSQECRFCTASAPFYRRLAAEAGDGTRLVALFPHDAGEGRAYLAALGVRVPEVRRVPLRRLSVAGTPTLILVDRTGRVTGAWMGQLPPEREREVLERIREGSAVAGAAGARPAPAT